MATNLWDESLLVPQSEEEQVGLRVSKPTNARQVIGIDYYEALGIKKFLDVDTPYGLNQEYELASEEGRLDVFLGNLRKAVYSSEKAAKLIKHIHNHYPSGPKAANAASSYGEGRRRGEGGAGGDDGSTDTKEGKEGRGAGSAGAAAAAAASAAAAAATTAAAAAAAATERKEGKEGAGGEGKERHADALSDEEDLVGLGMERDEGKEGKEGDGGGGGLFITAVADHSEGKGGDAGDEGGGTTERASRGEPSMSSSDVDRQSTDTYVARCMELQVNPCQKVIKSLGSATGDAPLGHYGLGTEGYLALCSALHHNRSVTHLDLADNWLQTPGLNPLSDALKINRSITRLDLSDNHLASEGAMALLDCLGAVTVSGAAASPITELSLKANGLDDTFGVRFCNEVLARPDTRLTTLDLSYNVFEDAFGEALGGALMQSFAVLSDLDIQWNKIGPKGAQAISEGLKINKSVAR